MKYFYTIAIYLISISTFYNCTSKKTSFTKSDFVGNKKPGNKGVIVFVHGIFGDAKGTWLNNISNASFPDLISKDITFNGYDVFSYGYPTSKFNLSYTIPDLAQDMNTIFDDNDIFNYENIIIISHSMGGLVTRQFLINLEKKYVPRIKMLYFYSTPTNGAAIAKWGTILSKNQNIGEMKPSDGDNYLSKMLQDWLLPNASDLRQIPSYCAYEKPTTNGIMVVPFSSASSLCNQAPIAILSDHFNIVKPENVKDKPYTVFRIAFRKEFLKKVEKLNDAPLSLSQTAPAILPPPQVKNFRYITNLRVDFIGITDDKNSNEPINFQVQKGAIIVGEALNVGNGVSWPSGTNNGVDIPINGRANDLDRTTLNLIIDKSNANGGGNGQGGGFEWNTLVITTTLEDGSKEIWYNVTAGWKAGNGRPKRFEVHL